MRITGPSNRSYPIKRKPRKGSAVIDNASEEVIDDVEVVAQQPRRQTGSTANVPRASSTMKEGAVPRGFSTIRAPAGTYA